MLVRVQQWAQAANDRDAYNSHYPGYAKRGALILLPCVPWTILRSVLTSDNFAKEPALYRSNNSNGRNCGLSQNVGSNPTWAAVVRE